MTSKVTRRLAACNKDYYGGALMLLFGAGAIYKGLGYRTGTLAHMGPGYFPVAVGVVLAVMGILIALSARSAAPQAAVDSPMQMPDWRGCAAIIVGTIAFIALGHYAGLLPATFAIVFISALGDRQNTFRRALVLAAAMTVICLVVFAWALKVQFPLFHLG